MALGLGKPSSLLYFLSTSAFGNDILISHLLLYTSCLIQRAVERFCSFFLFPYIHHQFFQPGLAQHIRIHAHQTTDCQLSLQPLSQRIDK